MKDAKYFTPATVDEAVRLLAEYGEIVTILAGGTDLVPKINDYQLTPNILLYIGGLALEYIEEQDGKLVIGAATTTGKIATSSLLAQKVPFLTEAARRSGCAATQTTATIGGNLANASPAADLATPLLAMDAELHLVSAKGKRVVALKNFFTGPGETLRNPDELLSEIRMTVPRGKTAFLKLGRRKAMTLSVVNVAVGLEMNGRKCGDARIALGSMAKTPIRCIQAEDLLKGKTVDTSLIDACATEAISECSPIDDQHASAWYRKRAGKALIVRALREAAGMDKQNKEAKGI